MLGYPVHVIVSGLFIAAMLTSIVSVFLSFESYSAIETFEIDFPRRRRKRRPTATCRRHKFRTRAVSCLSGK
jgi:hypothetical protein